MSQSSFVAKVSTNRFISHIYSKQSSIYFHQLTGKNRPQINNLFQVSIYKQAETSNLFSELISQNLKPSFRAIINKYDTFSTEIWASSELPYPTHQSRTCSLHEIPQNKELIFQAVAFTLPVFVKSSSFSDFLSLFQDKQQKSLIISSLF